MENFEINSNENQTKVDENKVKPEVNNNRSSNNYKYLYEGGIVELENKNLTEDKGRNGHLDTKMELGVEMRTKSECHNGEYYRIDAAAGPSETIDDNDDDEDQHLSDEHDNGEQLVEEIILLPNNFISDDELSSNSDDCVYAYRGGHINNIEANLMLEPNVNLVDDGQDEETDFLEMDFDPEPNSEIENFMEDERHFNHLQANFFTLRGEEGLRELPSVSQLRQNGSGSPLDDQVVAPEVIQEAPPQPSTSTDVIYTGAKPKLVTSSSAQKLSSSSSYSKDPYETDSSRPESSFKSLNTSNNMNSDDQCLECAEAEFIYQTKPEFSVERKCRRHCHSSQEVPSLSYASSPPPSTSSLPSDPSKVPSFTTTNTIQSTTSHTNKELMVTIYSINCDYETIVEATNLIGVSINTEILQHYFDNLADEETATMSVPEYLLYVSKRYCNYKRLIDVIKAACLDPVDIHFYPHDPFNPSIPDIVQISTSEITQRWNRNTDLRQILKFKNKHFKSLNVLGKVVSAIRQNESSDRLKITNSHINIPQYYRSGYICITKLANVASIVCS